MDQNQNPQQPPAQPGADLQPKIDPQSMVFRTMPKGYVPNSLPKMPSASAQQPPAQPQPAPGSGTGVPGGAGIRPIGVPGSSSGLRAASGMDSGTPGVPVIDLEAARGGRASDWVIKTILIILALGFLGFAGYFGYNRFFAKPKTTLTSNTSNSNNSGSGDQNQNSAPAPAPSPDQTQPQSQIPDSWQQKYFGAAKCQNPDVCGDTADPDHDGLSNLDEYKLGTDPNNPDSDADGIADGDEVHVFNLDPSNPKTAGIPKFTDTGDLNFKYNSHSHTAFTDTELQQIAANIKQYGLHSPSTKTLTATIIDFYTNYVPAASDSGSQPQTGALDRDTQRSYTIKQISFALLQYFDANQAYPDTTDFSEMVNTIKPLLVGKAVNPVDPTNVAPYVYTYQTVNGGTDFQIGYFSETEHQAVVLRAADAKAALEQDQAAQRDLKRENDLQQISGALNLYSNDHANPNNPTQLVFPTQATWKQSLTAKYLAVVPVDPSTSQDYLYSVTVDNSSFSLRAKLENPPAGKNGYLCTQDGCDFN